MPIVVKRQRVVSGRKTGSVRKLSVRGKRSYKRGPALDAVKRKLVYASEISLNPASASYSTYCFRANSLYDPDFTGGGHQPYGHDQLMEFYNYNRVISSIMKVRYTPSAVAELIPGYLAVLKSTSSAAPSFTDVDHFLESCYSQGVTPIPIGNFGGAFVNSAKGSQGNWITTSKWRYRTAFQSSPNDTSNWGTISAGPVSGVVEYYHVVLFCIAGNDPAAMNLTVIIEYTAEFFEPKLLTES